MRRFGIAVMLFFLCSEPLCALTLEEALKLALANNHQIKEFMERSRAQSERVRANRAPFMPELDADYAYSKGNRASLYQTKEISNFTTGITYNLFNGLSDLYNLRAEKSLLDASFFEQKAVEADVVLELKKAYIEVLRAKRNLDVAREAVELLTNQAKESRLYYHEQLVAKNEVLKVEVELATAQQELLVAEGLLRVARKGLERVMGVELKGGEPVSDICSLQPKPLDHDHLETMLKGRSELQYLAALRAARANTRKSIRGGYLPSVDLGLTFNQYGDSIVPDGREELYDTDTRVAVTARWNLFDGFRRKYNMAAEEAEIRANLERTRDTEEALSLQLNRTIESYEVSVGRLSVASKSVEQAEEFYRITNNQFRERMTTATELLDARVFLTRARNEYNNALYNMYQCIAETERVVEGYIGISLQCT